ncbi:hypothetical protein BQ8482_110189 [Mesorhizobium delmotii]|uniref:Uncharacterized protein n=1 Tax=Mesorhizobium delmotii TaxID=1631247 RepID=A0A2P9AAW4_9HYPH|nr:hypothetical protein BQ8482_110189 [Mesorhizobium delmotii]
MAHSRINANSETLKTDGRVVPREGGDWQVSNVRCRANRQLCPFQDCGSLIYYSDHLVRRIRFAHMQPATRARA